jgi:hypothetical protein
MMKLYRCAQNREGIERSPGIGRTYRIPPMKYQKITMCNRAKYCYSMQRDERRHSGGGHGPAFRGKNDALIQGT